MTVAVVEKRYQVIKPKHGFYKGECLDTDICPTIDTGVGCWHTLIGEIMEEVKCEQVGTLSGGKWDKMHEQNRRVYSTNGLSPTLHTMGGGNTELKIAEPIVVDEIYNNRKPRIYSEHCPTIRAERQGLEVIEPNEQYIGCAVHPLSKKLEFDGYKDTVCPTLLATDYKCPKTIAYEVETQYRIRKLTENECGRLMGVKSEDCEKIAKNQSTSSQYHLYGDSIVTTCLMAIFGELFDCDYQNKINELVGELKQ